MDPWYGTMARHPWACEERPPAGNVRVIGPELPVSVPCRAQAAAPCGFCLPSARLLPIDLQDRTFKLICGPSDVDATRISGRKALGLTFQFARSGAAMAFLCIYLSIECIECYIKYIASYINMAA